MATKFVLFATSTFRTIPHQVLTLHKHIKLLINVYMTFVTGDWMKKTKNIFTKLHCGLRYILYLHGLWYLRNGKHKYCCLHFYFRILTLYKKEIFRKYLKTAL